VAAAGAGLRAERAARRALVQRAAVRDGLQSCEFPPHLTALFPLATLHSFENIRGQSSGCAVLGVTPALPPRCAHSAAARSASLARSHEQTRGVRQREKISDAVVRVADSPAPLPPHQRDVGVHVGPARGQGRETVSGPRRPSRSLREKKNASKGGTAAARRLWVPSPDSLYLSLSRHPPWLNILPSGLCVRHYAGSAINRGLPTQKALTVKLRQWLGFLGLRTVVRGWGSCEPCYH
jgi:hypothetical protein